MTASLQVAQAQRYTLGVALTDAQVAALKTDIVWLVKQTVTLADGSTQEVLVPQVYVHASNVEVTGQGTLIAGNDVAFQAAQDIVNSGGTIAARKGVSLAGANLQNLGGRISGADVQVAAVVTSTSRPAAPPQTTSRWSPSVMSTSPPSTKPAKKNSPGTTTTAPKSTATTPSAARCRALAY
ncbi:adhesin HecA-like repeat protein [Herbaspirillum rubrisubalbicans]|uniref:hypothetical protein n=1 Tax=Herbaspirillum rubrisubalbicans TaxID=80842 RepID=UPI00209CE8B3|nr:hypothetical protein [Herbaspirillum rubrisubalbicans]MCP1571686.1 adhesin HecA-like repeat protein [Herbaspirillum rubrisubalbicans]